MNTQMRDLIMKHLLTLLIALMGSVAFAQDVEEGVATTGVNFRSGPSTKHRIITGVEKGEFFKILGKTRAGNWTKVQLATGKVGFIYSKYVGTSRDYVDATEGGYQDDNCPACKKDRLNPAQAQAQLITTLMNPVGAAGQCVTRKMMEGAYQTVRQKRYDKRGRDFKGNCAKAVRMALNKAGIWSGGGIGHARDMVPGLQRMGFKNLYKPGMTPASAPANTILVYGAPKNKRGCRGKGTTYGHVEIKKSNSEFIYDGISSRNIQQIFGANCRILKGVMQMGDSCPTCKKEVKRTCGA